MKKLLSAFALTAAIIAGAASKDPRMEHFADFIKPESQIKSTHPFLLFSKKDIPKIRAKMNTPYFKNYTADLLTFADVCLKKYPDTQSFPFTENPNYQTISEALVMAYLLTGDEKYSKKAIALTAKFADDHYLKVPVRDSGKFAGHLKNGNSISFILNTVALVYDSLYNEMTPEERFKIRKALAYFCKITYEMAIKEEYGLGFHKNYRAGGMGALGLACLAIKDDTNLEVHEWLDKAKRVSIAWCNVAIKSDGVYPEGVTYLYYMLRNQLLFFEALKRYEKVDFLKRSNLKNALIWTLFSSLPWKYEFDNFGDAKYGVTMYEMPFIFQKEFPGYGDFLVRKVYGGKLRYRSNPWAILYGQPPAKIAHSPKSAEKGFFSRLFGGGKHQNSEFNPYSELGLSKLFPFGGVAIFRTGWEPNDMLLLAYATDYEYAAHSQADRGQFNLYAYGRKWAVDSGYGNDGKTANSATPPEAHNLILIDEKGEAFDPSMRQSGTFAEVVDFQTDDHLGYVKIDQKDAYDWYVRYHYVNKKEWNPVRRAFRNIIFINKGETPPYVIVYDDIRKDDEKHDYTWLFHTAPSNMMKTVQNGVDIFPSQFRGKAIHANGTGTWDDFIAPGFNIFKFRPGDLTFKVSVPEGGKHALWAYARGDAYCWGETEVLVNGKSYARFAIGKTRDFSWLKFADNHHKMHETIFLDMKKGVNEIRFKGVSSGYEVARCLLTKNADFIPTAADSSDSGGIVFDHNNLASFKDAVVEGVDATSDARCAVRMLNPAKIAVSTDYYQPSRDPLHQRALFKTNAVEPNFLAMIYPSEKGMEQPVTQTNVQGKTIVARISWRERDDYVILNPEMKTLRFKGIETKAKLLYARFAKDGTLIRKLESATPSEQRARSFGWQYATR